MKLFEKLAGDIERRIRSGVYRPDDRLPSLRQASQQRKVSVTTVLRAYLLLESRGLVVSRPQSGFFVHSAPADDHGSGVGSGAVMPASAATPLALSA